MNNTRNSVLLVILLFLLLPAQSILAQAPPAKEVVVELKGGDQIHGRLSEEDDESIVIVSPVLGTLTVLRENIVSITEVNEGGDPEKDSAPKVVAKTEEKVKSPWSGSINLGLTYSEAATRTAAFNLSAAIKKANEDEKFVLNAKYFYSTNAGVVSDNDVIANADQTWFINRSRWSLFALGTYQWDEFQTWEHRVSPYGGLGYAVVEKEDLDLTLRLGAGGTWEYASRELLAQFLFEVKTNWKINSLQSFEGSVRFAPKMDNFLDYIMTLSMNYKLKLGADSPFSLNLSILDIYDSKPTGSTNNDLKLVLSLGYDF